MGPLMLVGLVAIGAWIRLRPIPRGFKGDVFPHAYRLAWIVLITQNLIAQLVTGPPTVWNEMVFSIYDSNGDVTQETSADGSNYSYTYNALGEMLTATDPTTGTTSFTYDTQGSLASVDYPNGTSLTYTYNSLGQLTQQVDQSGYTLNYTYNSQGLPYQLLNGSNQPITTYG